MRFSGGIWQLWNGGWSNCDDGTTVVANITSTGGASEWTSASGGIAYGSGNVGIGTTAPDTALHVERVNEGGEAILLRLNNGAGSTNSTASLVFENTTGAGDHAKISAIRTNAVASGDTDLRFSTLGSSALTERLRITSAGNVGIGTASPVSNLEVSSTVPTIRLGDTTGGETSFKLTADASTFRVTDEATSFDVLRIKAGNMGVGIDPTVKFEVQANRTFKLGNAYVSSGGNSAHFATNEWFDGASWQRTADGGLLQIAGQDMGYLSHTGGTHTTLLKILGSSGNVGIGTTLPGQKLDVVGNLNIQNADPYLIWYENDQGADAKRWDMMSAGGVLALRTVNDAYSAATSAMEITRSANTVSKVTFPNGNVGIGTTTPKEMLDVRGNITMQGGLMSNLYFDGAWKATSTGYGGYLAFDRATGIQYFWNTPSSVSADAAQSLTARLAILPNGNVGIGTASPAHALEVSGSAVQVALGATSTGGVQFLPQRVMAARLASGWALRKEAEADSYPSGTTRTFFSS